MLLPLIHWAPDQSSGVRRPISHHPAGAHAETLFWLSQTLTDQ